jgi:2,4-dienoyl-CoA reductase-like NADH-dependent reductase (Old Yellow Enzyme family)/thioredoxin reductase
MKKLKHLFNPISIGSIELKNRIVMSPMGTNLASPNGEVTQALIRYYAARAEGGVGLIVTEDATIGPKYGVNSLMLNDDRLIDGWIDLARAVHAFDAKIAPQLMHPGFNARSSLNNGVQPVAASPIPSRFFREIPKELTADEIEQIIEQFAFAARRAQEAGCDGVMLHCAHNYHMLGSFMSALHNKRADSYGGSLEGRLRLPLEVIRRIRSKTGPGFPILIRISGAEFEPGGRTIEESQYIAPLLVEAGVNAIQISAGTLNFPWISTPPMGTPLAPNAPFAEAIKKAVDVPVICGTRITNPQIAENILSTEKADMIAMGRALLADPAFPNKAAKGLWDDIIPCVGDLYCLVSVLSDRKICCMTNPAVGLEAEMALQPAESSQKVLVAGGGPAGLEAARVAALRGHKVTLLEKTSKLGGQLLMASFPPMKQEMVHIIQYLITQVYKAGVQVDLHQEVTAETVKRLQPDVVIVATGGVPRIPAEFSGAASRNIFTAWDILQGSVLVGPRVVVVGGGKMGCEVADFLAHPVNDRNPRGNQVTLLEMLDNIALNEFSSFRSMLVQRLLTKGVRIITSAKVTGILDDTVKYLIADKEETIRGINTIVLALGTQSNDTLKEELNGNACRKFVIGDAREPRSAVEAIREGAEIARKI